MQEKFIAACSALRRKNPLVHCITNYVAAKFNADTLLAAGASPLMSYREEEIGDIAAVCSALYVNIGCPDKSLTDSASVAVTSVSAYGKPWVLDPAGAGIGTLRADTAIGLMQISHPAIIRGNASEIMALAGDGARGKGVDSIAGSGEALDSARALARSFGCVVVVSGAEDYITDGTDILTVSNGSPLMSRVSGTGCSVSALCAAFASVEPDFLCAAWCAMALMGVAGERASQRSVGLGSFQTALLDELSIYDPAQYAGYISGRVF